MIGVPAWAYLKVAGTTSYRHLSRGSQGLRVRHAWVMQESELRISELVICSARHTAEEIGKRVGIASDNPGRDCWTIRETGDDAADIDSITGAVLARLDEAWPTLRVLAEESDMTIVMRVVAYLSPADRVGGGITFDQIQLQQLASIGAVLDLDLYGVE